MHHHPEDPMEARDWETEKATDSAGADGGEGRDTMTVERISKPKTKKHRDAATRAITCASIQHQIWALRKERGWTQAELARRAGMPQNVISRLEQPSDRLVTLRTLIKIANAFDVLLSIRFGKGEI